MGRWQRSRAGRRELNLPLLSTLTLLSAGILVVALVAGLTVALVFLISVSRNLGRVRNALTTVVEEAGRLSRGVEHLHGAASACAAELAEARAKLGRAHDRLAELTERGALSGGR